VRIAAGASAGAQENLSHEWTICRNVVEQPRVPVILAGGLSADNLAQVIAAVKLWGVDVSGRRGKKDRARVRAFLSAAPRGFAAIL